jgi:hypothetical protein
MNISDLNVQLRLKRDVDSHYLKTLIVCRRIDLRNLHGGHLTVWLTPEHILES